MPTILRRRRHARLRRQLAPQRGRVQRAVRTTLAAQQKALQARPTAPPPVTGTTAVATTLTALARELRTSAGGDAQVKAAARGVGALAGAYRDIAAAARASSLEQSARLTRRSVAALAAAQREQRKAGDAWPF